MLEPRRFNPLSKFQTFIGNSFTIWAFSPLDTSSSIVEDFITFISVPMALQYISKISSVLLNSLINPKQYHDVVNKRDMAISSQICTPFTNPLLIASLNNILEPSTISITRARGERASFVQPFEKSCGRPIYENNKRHTWKITHFPFHGLRVHAHSNNNNLIKRPIYLVICLSKIRLHHYSWKLLCFDRVHEFFSSSHGIVDSVIGEEFELLFRDRTRQNYF